MKPLRCDHAMQLVSILLACVLLTACSPPAEAPVPEHSAIGVQLEYDADVSAFTPLESQLVSGGIAATYTAYLDGSQLRVLREQRPALRQSAEYRFQGARLLHYRGHALPRDGAALGAVELEFDLAGRQVAARKLQPSPANIDDAIIASIRTRADVLRSHALARHASRSHTAE